MRRRGSALLASRRPRSGLTPSMNSLHKKLLAWKYEDSGDMPPDARTTTYKTIPDTFTDCDSYAGVFEPLLLLECWAQFQRAKEETAASEPSEATLQSRMCVDEFQDITFEMAIADMDDVADHDVLVLTESMSREKRYAKGITAVGLSGQIGRQGDAGSTANPALLNRPTILGKVQSRVFGRDNVQVVVRVFMQGVRLAQFLNKLVLKSVWVFIKLYGLTPMHREYAALRSLPYLDRQLVQEILVPRPVRHQMLGKLDVEKCMRMHALNQPQAEAVVAAVNRSNGFTLIQGPPGTGKTKTILGLAGALISQAKKQLSDDYKPYTPAGPDAEAPPTAKKNNKLLICAPSNAAVDEIVKRLKQGIRDDTGKTFFPSVVRVGMSDSVSSTVRDTTLDFLLDKALNSYGGVNGTKGTAGDENDISAAQDALLTSVSGHRGSDGRVVDMAARAKVARASAVETQRSLRKRLDDVNVRRRELDQRMQTIDPSNMAEMREFRQKFGKLNEEKKRVCAQLDSERERGREAARTIDSTKHKIRLQILQTTDILCCTLSGSGHDMMASIQCSFDTCHYRRGCAERRAGVPDPAQVRLPAVHSWSEIRTSCHRRYCRRLRCSTCTTRACLSGSRRTAPSRSICSASSTACTPRSRGSRPCSSTTPSSRTVLGWLRSRLRRGTPAASSRHSASSISARVRRSRASRTRCSTWPRRALQCSLVQHLCISFPSLPMKQTIGVITPYKQQKSTLVRQFQSCFGQAVTDAIEFNTVDGFQGQEKDIIIFSCVRAGGSGVGFLADERRMNVGLTRARKSMFVLGNSDLLVVSPLWRKLIDDAKQRSLLLDCKLPLFGRYLGNAATCDNLTRDPKDAMDTAADGEGDRAEFILEAFNDSELKRANAAAATPAVPAVKQIAAQHRSSLEPSCRQGDQAICAGVTGSICKARCQPARGWPSSCLQAATADSTGANACSAPASAPRHRR
ncbi:hypothetical protein DL89DRAFT_129430 [Linderina pennispora]|uniref:P-loop containing nucleoside triphosphate hydrolase protein n=1 Tax=Linderina pennispora TaxID=61395 RepID=A0A1Y1WDJ4_9FUNG|nr:uncharacterized protein DL89DRAFT_129430 [Linderina pennispora]ORX71599.1 hypothetical protein DL89DRAFT_129430 [Linderina pennispora]